MYKRIGGIFPKLVAAFLMILIPLCVLGLMMYRSGELGVKNEWIGSMNSRTLFYMNTLELEKRHIIDLLSENVYDQDMSHLSVLSGIMTQFEWSEAVKRIQEKLRLIRNSSIYAASANVHMLTLGRTINDTNGILGTIADDYEAVKPGEGTGDGVLLRWQDRLFIRQSFPAGSSSPTYVLSVEINRAELESTLRSMANAERSGAALIARTGGWEIDYGADSGAVAELRSRFPATEAQAGGERTFTMTLDGTTMQAACRYSASFDAYLCLYLPQEQMVGQISQYRNWLWLLSGVSVLIVLLYSNWIYRLIHRPLRKMIHAFRRVEDGRLEPVTPTKGRDEFRYLYLHFNRMVENLKSLIHDNYEQKLLTKQSQIKQLQSQINPHFLYNTYFILYRLSEFGDLESIGRFTRYLGEYFEFITRHKDDTILLELEVRHTMTYIEIQNMRFFNRFEIEIEPLSDDCRSVEVPKLILQPIVENAFKYGLEPRQAGGRLRVAFRQADGRTLIEVEDNGEQLSDEELGRLASRLKQSWEEEESTGMINVHRRLKLLCGEDSGVEVRRGEWGGLQVTLSIRSGRPA